MNALSVANALAWANEGTKEFYFAVREQRREEADERMRQAQAEREHENRVVRSVEICAQGCRQQAHLCQADCGRHQVCRNDCAGANNACVGACGSRGKRELGIDPAYD